MSAVTPMAEKIQFLWPEIAMFLTTCIVMVMGLSPRLAVRQLCGPLAALGLAAAGMLAYLTTPVGAAGAGLLPNLVPFAKILVAAVGIIFLLLMSGTVDREEETAIARGRIAFNPLRTNRAEFYAFFLFSLTGVMLCATATDLIWLFLALELTSLPTYIMVTISRTGRAGSRSQEAGVKYFFLGALGAAIFLYGFALLYGGTGTTNLAEMREIFMAGGINPIAMLGMLIALVGIGFKIAAVPMHLYTPDVYEGAAAQISAFLAFVPKTAGFIAILLLVSAMGWHYSPDTSIAVAPAEVGLGASLPGPVRLLLWVMAALTMTWGNVLALLQNNVKRMLAYSSIAHSGYILVGVIAGPINGTSIVGNGIGAVLFYLLAYGVMNMGAFAVLACLERPAGAASKESKLPPASGEAAEPERPDEIESIEDLRGLCYSHPILGWTMVICAASLLGLPPLLGFFGKVPLFTAGIAAGEYPLVIILGINSAIAAFYYLRLVAFPLLESPTESARHLRPTPFGTRFIAGTVSAGAVVVLSILGGVLMSASNRAGQVREGPLAAPIRADAPPEMSEARLEQPALPATR